MPVYIASPHSAATSITRVALVANTAKTVLQLGIPANNAPALLGWGISFRGVAPTDPPGDVWLVDSGANAATVTSLTPDPWRVTGDVPSYCVGGTTATGYNASAEGTLTTGFLLDAQLVHPQTGYAMWWPAGAQPRPGTTTARLIRVRCNFSVGLDCVPWIIWEE